MVSMQKLAGKCPSWRLERPTMEHSRFVYNELEGSSWLLLGPSYKFFRDLMSRMIVYFSAGGRIKDGFLVNA